jgi:PAT family beta-lactamase induction signal transducer AmpG
VRIIGFTGAAIVQSLLLLLLTILTVFIRERTHDVLFSFRLKEYQIPLPASRQLPSIGLIFKELFSALFSTLSLRTFGVIALVYTCLSIFIRSLNVHLIQKLHWTDTYLSSISSSYVVVGAILVIFGGGILSDKLGAKKMLLFVMFIIGSYLLIFNLLSPLWNDRTFSTTGLLFWYMFDPSFSIAAMPLLMNICRKGIEGSQFTTYMSLVNFCDVAGAYLSGIILLWVSTPQIGVVCGLLLVSISLYLHYQAKVVSTSPPLNS